MANNMTIDELAGIIKGEFDNVGHRFDKVEGDIVGIKGDIVGIKGDIVGIKGDIVGIKASMVTKDYLDEKLGDLRGDLVVLMRKEDTKVGKLIEILKRRKIITEIEKKEILSMDPFAKLFI